MNSFFSRSLIAAMLIAGLSLGQPPSKLMAQDKGPITEALSQNSPANFQSIDLATTSLRFASDDASYYSASYQLSEQWKAFVQGAFVQQLLKTKAAQKYIAACEQMWNDREGSIGQLRRNLDNPNIGSILDVLFDVTSEEVFMLADSKLPGSSLALNQLYEEIQSVVAGSPEQITEYIMSIRKEDIDKIAIPTLVIGGKAKNTETVLQQIDILEALLTFGLGNVPPPLLPLQEGLKRIEGESGTRITMTLKSSMIPWDVVGGNPDLAELATKLESVLENRQVAISFGMFHEYLIFSMSESVDDIEQLDKVSNTLLDSTPMQLVRSKAKSPIIGVGYASDAIANVNFQVNLEDFFSKNLGRVVLAAQNEISNQISYTEDEDELATLESWLDLLDLIPEDLAWLDSEIGQHVPVLKGQTSVAIAQPDGAEYWLQNRTNNVILDSQATLPVLNHVGAEPIALVAGRRAHHPEYFQSARLIVQKIHSYLERIADEGLLSDESVEEVDDESEEDEAAEEEDGEGDETNADADADTDAEEEVDSGTDELEASAEATEATDDDEADDDEADDDEFDDVSPAEQLNIVLDKGWPLLVELADIIEQDFIPSMKDGQFAFVLSPSQITSKQWIAEMPTSDSDLPLLEFAEVVGVSDSEQFFGGFEKLYDLFDKAVETLREIEPDEVPADYSVPRPESAQHAAGPKFFYAIPDECPVPKTMTLQAVFGKQFAFFNYSDPQMDLLTKSKPLAVKPEFIQEHKTISAVLYFDIGRFFSQIKPWVHYGAAQDTEAIAIEAQDGFPEITKEELLELYDALEKCGEFISVESGLPEGTMAHGRYFRK